MSDQENNALSTFFNVDSLKAWTNPFLGAALALSDAYKTHELKGELYIGYLQNGSTNAGQGEAPNKNHVVFQVPFVQPYDLQIEGKTVKVRGARISMDLTDETLDNIDKDRVSSLLFFLPFFGINLR